MADRFDKFTDRARQVLSLAQEEAYRFQHNYIGTEHQLLGLVRVEEGVGAKVLVNLGAPENKIRSAVEMIIGRGSEGVHGEIAFTPRAKKVIEMSVDEARRMNHHYIGTEHLLLGLLRVSDGIAAGVLTSLGVTLDKARAEVKRILSQEMPSGAGAPRSDLGGLPLGNIRESIKARWAARLAQDPAPAGVKRYNLALPEDLFQEVQDLADRQHTTVVELLRRFVKLGLLATQVQDTPGAALIIREGEREREILLL